MRPQAFDRTRSEHLLRGNRTRPKAAVFGSGIHQGPPLRIAISGTALTTVSCTFARRLRTLVAQLREAHAGLAERARAEERNRIAAEMHDVIGHAMTVSLLHVSSARLALDEDPAEAGAALAEAERLARQSLDEVRGVVGLMRGAGPRAVVPLPRGTDVTDLVDSFRRAGTRVELDVRGGLDTLGATHGLAVYRVVQESLTNAARHGDGTPVSIRIDIDGDRTIVTVDSGCSAASAAATGGAGLVVMSILFNLTHLLAFFVACVASL